MSSRKRASLSSNSPLDQLFAPAQEREEHEEEREPERVRTQNDERKAAPSQGERRAQAGSLVQEAAPAEEEEERELRQTTIMIYDDQADWLDEASYLARRESGSNVSKAAILRALVDMAREEADVRERLRERLGI